MATLIGPNAVTDIPNRGNGSDIASFIEFLGSPDTQIPLDSNFLLVFESDPILPLALTSSFPVGLENGYWDVDSVKSALTSIVIKGENNAPLGGRGCMFVHAFDVPGEAIASSRPGTLANNSSFRSGVVSGERTQYNSTVDLGILETNKSFTEFVIRPWIALVSHYGLFTRGPQSTQNVKTNMSGILFDRNNKNQVRKVYKFSGVAPISMSSVNYAFGKNDARIDKVSFVFNNFGIAGSYSKNIPPSPAAGSLATGATGRILSQLPTFNTAITPTGTQLLSRRFTPRG